MLATVSDKGQVTLPKALRERMGIQPGSRLEFALASDGTLQVRLMARGAGPLFGLLARPGQRRVTQAEMEGAVTAAVRLRSRPAP